MIFTFKESGASVQTLHETLPVIFLFHGEIHLTQPNSSGINPVQGRGPEWLGHGQAFILPIREWVWRPVLLPSGNFRIYFRKNGTCFGALLYSDFCYMSNCAVSTYRLNRSNRTTSMPTARSGTRMAGAWTGVYPSN